MRMIAPLPYDFSICDTAAPIAFVLSTVSSKERFVFASR
jgi:hypothetical protein